MTSSQRVSYNLRGREVVAERRYRWVAGHDADGSPIYFTCGERLWKQLEASRKRRAKKLEKQAK